VRPGITKQSGLHDLRDFRLEWLVSITAGAPM
jgi:hypothetical protein